MKKLSTKAIFTNFLGTLIVAIFGFFAILSFFTDDENPLVDSLDLSPGLVITIGVILFLLVVGYTVLWVRLFRYEIAQDEFKKEYGVISKSYVSIPYGRVQNVNIQRSLFERILGISTVEIQTAGNEMARKAEGRLPGLEKQVAEEVREAILDKARPGRREEGVDVPQPGL